jgi:N-methylhydantoinase B/oxoprolinase/acetone carboxylase alpha subunit
MVSGNGGGWGDPQLRPAEAVADDLRNGYITPERARAVYGDAVVGDAGLEPAPAPAP